MSHFQICFEKWECKKPPSSVAVNAQDEKDSICGGKGLVKGGGKSQAEDQDKFSFFESPTKVKTRFVLREFRWKRTLVRGGKSLRSYENHMEISTSRS